MSLHNNSAGVNRQFENTSWFWPTAFRAAFKDPDFCTAVNLALDTLACLNAEARGQVVEVIIALAKGWLRALAHGELSAEDCRAEILMREAVEQHVERLEDNLRAERELRTELLRYIENLNRKH
jgi:hypothetical protein